MPTPLRVLILEDNPSDAELVLHELRQSGFDPEWQRVETEEEYLAALHPALDIILSDYSLPQFDGLSALRLLRARGPDLPFILVSGTIGEEVAVECLKQGADDYLLKDRLTRLGPAVKSVLEQKRLREEKQGADEQLRHTQARLADILENAAEAIVAVNRKQCVVTFNKGAKKMFGYTAKEILGQPLDLLIPERLVEIHRQHVQDFAVSAEQTNPMEHRRDLNARRKDGSVFPVEIGISKLVGDGQELYTAIIVDITERKQAEERLRYLSMHDALTGLYNRAFFEEEMSRLERGRQFPVSVVMVDVDDLKRTNDSQGHAAGDELLRQAAEVLRAAFRADDVVARIGGDEFAVLLPGADASVTQQALERLRSNLAGYYNATPSAYPLSLSIGTATVIQGGSLKDALKQADEDMYREKNGLRGLP